MGRGDDPAADAPACEADSGLGGDGVTGYRASVAAEARLRIPGRRDFRAAVQQHNMIVS